MNLSQTLRELFTENPMLLEATRTIRRTLRAGNNNENPRATRNLNRALLAVLMGLYLWMLVGIVRSGEDISFYLVFGELVLLTLLVPGSLYGAVAVEREKQTYESLIMTRLTPSQIVAGKLIWRVGLILGIMAVFAPLLAVSHFGNQHGWSNDMTGWQLVWTQVIVFAWSSLVGAFSLWVSARSKKGITALMGIVGTLIGFLALLPALCALFGVNQVYVPTEFPLILWDDRAYTFDYYGSGTETDVFLGGLQRMVSSLFASFFFDLSPFVTIAMKFTTTSEGSNMDAINYWLHHGIGYWGVAVYAMLTGVFVRASVKTLRGLEMPVAEKVRRRRALGFPTAKPQGEGA